MNKLIENLQNLFEEENSEKEKWFLERTNKHIELVKEAARKISQTGIVDGAKLMNQVEKHDQSKFQEPERTPYIEISWRHKQDNYKSYKKPGTLPDKKENEATLYHIVNNSHHPEYWNKEEANISKEDRDKSDKVLDATKMPDLAIAEMVADWQAMSEELKNNTAREWFNKQREVRWHFNEYQEELIGELLRVFERKEEESTKGRFITRKELLSGNIKGELIINNLDGSIQSFKEFINSKNTHLEEKTQIEKIILKATIGLYPEHTTGSEFDVLMKDGKKYSYTSETSPYIHRKFFYLIKKGYLGKAIEVIKPHTKRVNNDRPE